MGSVFELWDMQSRNLLDTYENEDDALEDVFAALSEHGPNVVATLLLGQDVGDRSHPIAEGAELARRAQAWHDGTSVARTTRRRASAAS